MTRRYYPVVIHKDADSDYGAAFVDFPATCGGATAEAALSEAEALLADVVADMRVEGKRLPEPTPIAAIPPDLLVDAVAVSLTPVSLPGRARRLSITLDEELILAIDAVAPNRSAFLAEAARAKLAR